MRLVCTLKANLVDLKLRKREYLQSNTLVDLSANRGKARICKYEKSNHVINMLLTAMLDILKRFAASLIRSTNLNLTKVKTDSTSKI